MHTLGTYVDYIMEHNRPSKRRKFRTAVNVARAVNACWGEKAWAATTQVIDEKNGDDDCSGRASMTRDYLLKSTAPEPRINEQTLAPGYKLNDESSSATAANCFVKQSSSPVISPNNAVKMPKEQNKSGDDIDYVIVSKGKNDVLTGRGNSINLHPGNERFRCLIQKRKETYQNLKTRPQKKRFSERIIDEVQLYGGQFLKRLPGSLDEIWILQDRNKAREKVSQALRDASKYKSTA